MRILRFNRPRHRTPSAAAILAGVTCIYGSILTTPLTGQDTPSLSVDGPMVVLTKVPFTLTIRTDDGAAAFYSVSSASGRVLVSGALPIRSDIITPDIEVDAEDLPLLVEVQSDAGEAQVSFTRPQFPGWISLLPPLLAIALALLFREVVVSLFFGVWLGAWFVGGLNPITGLWRAIDTFVVPSLADPGHASILIFSALLSAMVGVVSCSGGTRGIVEAVRPLATTPRRAQLATFFAGLTIFFDDYANTLIVGNTFRPISDKLKISREKLAYLVDSTAAPVVTIVFVSTWVGFEISLIADGLKIAAEQTTNPALSNVLATASPFTLFLSTIPYLFYPILSLLMVGLIIAMQRDFGPMHGAETRARSGGGVFRPGSQLLVNTEETGLDVKEGIPLRWYNAVVPVFTVVFVVLFGLYFDGRSAIGTASIWDTFGAADPFKAILWGSLAGCMVAIGMPVGQKIITLKEGLSGWLAGVRAMTMGFVILILAWSLGEVTEQLATARYLTQVLEGGLSPELLPALTFGTAAVISFCTGTSWATMTILMPLVIPLMVALGGVSGFEGGLGTTLLASGVSSVLAGSIFGDHCSPISDTTVLSSMSSACDHMDHVRTQLPYALVVAITALLFGHLATSYGTPIWVAYGLSVSILVGVVRLVGKPVPEL
jgi:Na+/H+ antiporter NhaC